MNSIFDTILLLVKEYIAISMIPARTFNIKCVRQSRKVDDAILVFGSSIDLFVSESGRHQRPSLLGFAMPSYSL